MFETVLAYLGKTFLTELLKKIASAGLDRAGEKMSKAQMRHEVEGIVRLNLELPPSTPKAETEKLVSTVTSVVLPTFEEIVRFDPNTNRIVYAAKAASKTAPAKKAVARKAVASKKAAPRKTFAKKAVAKKVVGKKAIAKKAVAKS